MQVEHDNGDDDDDDEYAEEVVGQVSQEEQSLVDADEDGVLAEDGVGLPDGESAEGDEHLVDVEDQENYGEESQEEDTPQD